MNDASLPVVYLSPHLDDAVLSCGARIVQDTQAGRRVWIVTVFSGDAPSDASHLAVGGGVNQGRRLEDARACAVVGAECRHWPFPEAAFRTDPVTARPLYPAIADLFGEMQAADEALISRVAARVRELPPECRLVAPLGVGGHVDHWVTRKAAELAAGADLLYFEDFPYAQKWGALRKVLRPRARWRSTATRVTAADLELKCRAIAAHASQAAILFNDDRDLKRKVVRYAFRRRGEQYWQRV